MSFGVNVVRGERGSPFNGEFGSPFAVANFCLDGELGSGLIVYLFDFPPGETCTVR